MSFPQPDADQYAKNGYKLFRLNTLLTSPGDIYQSTQSGHGMAIGPESDLANVNVAYFDDQVPVTFMQRTTISANRAFTGRVDARNDTVYMPANRSGRIFFWAQDIYDPNYRPISKPASFDHAKDAIRFVPPRLDVIEFFRPVQGLVPGRDDKSFVFQNYPVVLGRFYLVIPYYGRRYAHVHFTNREGLGSNTIGVVGVNYTITQNDSVNPYHQETTLLAPTAIGPGGESTLVVTGRTSGMFDALVVSLTKAGPAPLRMVVSDLEP